MEYDEKKDLENNKNNTFNITIDPTSQFTKPPKDDNSIGKISNSISLVTGVTIDNFQSLTSRPKSYTWFGGLFDNNLSNENWKEQSVFAIDFDKGNILVEDALKRLHEKSIYPQLYYTTLSSSEELLKFRIVLFIDVPIKIEQHRKNIIDGLLRLFPEADKTCRNACRFFFGGIDSFILHYEPISTQKLLDAMCIELITKDNDRPRGLYSGDTENCQLGEKRALPYNIYEKYRNSPTGTSINKNQQTTYLVGGQKVDINVARRNVRIFDEFLNGTWLYHMELFGLATNLKYIKGGLKLMKNTMLKYNEKGQTNYTADKFAIITYINNVDYYPQSIWEFSKYKEDEELYDIVTASKNVRGHVDCLESFNKVSLKEAELKFKTSFNEALQDNSNSIFLFVLPTAIGKTEALTDINATIATPTNDLKNEIALRMKVDYVKTPDPIQFSDESLMRKIDYYYRIGKPKNVVSILYDVIDDKMGEYSEVDKEKATTYVNSLKRATKSSKSVITTHSRAIHSTFNNDIIVFDEDPINSLIEIKQLDITDLKKIYYQGNNNDLKNVIEFLESSCKKVINQTPFMEVCLEEMIENVSLSSIETNVFDFFGSSYFMRDDREPHIFHYVIKRELPTDKKVIILSATLSLFIYKKLFGDRLKVIDIRDVEQVGEVIQYTKRSCSRRSLNQYVTDISENVGDKPVLTFKSFSSKFKNPIQDMYFGNCSGYDSMKGKDMVVVGTPHRNSVQYLMTAKILGLDIKTSDSTMFFQKVEYNGFRFMFNCFENEDLKQIQLSFIESDLIQAVGRARTLRERASVELYSNFPLRVSNRFVY